jgi:hypothetical protein
VDDTPAYLIFVDCSYDILRESELAGRAKDNLPRRFVAKEADERANRPSAGIAGECDTFASDAAEPPSEGENIRKGLGGVLIPTVPALITGFCELAAMRWEAPLS